MEEHKNVSSGRMTEGMARANEAAKEVSGAASLMNDMVVDPAAVEPSGASVAGNVAGTARRKLELETSETTRCADLAPTKMLERYGGHYVADKMAWVEEYNRTHPNKITIYFEPASTSGKAPTVPIIKYNPKPVTIEAYDVPSEAFFQFKKLQEAAINRLLGETST